LGLCVGLRAWSVKLNKEVSAEEEQRHSKYELEPVVRDTADG